MATTESSLAALLTAALDEVAPAGLASACLFGSHAAGRRLSCADAEIDHAFVRDVQLRAADIESFLRRARRLKLSTLARSASWLSVWSSRSDRDLARGDRFSSDLVRRLERLPGFRNVVSTRTWRWASTAP